MITAKDITFKVHPPDDLPGNQSVDGHVTVGFRQTTQANYDAVPDMQVDVLDYLKRQIAFGIWERLYGDAHRRLMELRSTVMKGLPLCSYDQFQRIDRELKQMADLLSPENFLKVSVGGNQAHTSTQERERSERTQTVLLRAEEGVTPFGIRYPVQSDRPDQQGGDTRGHQVENPSARDVADVSMAHQIAEEIIRRGNLRSADWLPRQYD